MFSQFKPMRGIFIILLFVLFSDSYSQSYEDYGIEFPKMIWADPAYAKMHNIGGLPQPSHYWSLDELGINILQTQIRLNEEPWKYAPITVTGYNEPGIKVMMRYPKTLYNYWDAVGYAKRIVDIKGQLNESLFHTISGYGEEFFDQGLGYEVIEGFPDNITPGESAVFCKTWYLLRLQYKSDTFESSLGPDPNNPYNRFGYIKIKARREAGNYSGILMKTHIWDSPQHQPAGELPEGNRHWYCNFGSDSPALQLTEDYQWFDISVDQISGLPLLFRSKVWEPGVGEDGQWVNAQQNMEFILFGDPDLNVYIDSIKVYDMRGEEVMEAYLGYLVNPNHQPYLDLKAEIEGVLYNYYNTTNGSDLIIDWFMDDLHMSPMYVHKIFDKIIRLCTLFSKNLTNTLHFSILY